MAYRSFFMCLWYFRRAADCCPYLVNIDPHNIVGADSIRPLCMMGGTMWASCPTSVAKFP